MPAKSRGRNRSGPQGEVGVERQGASKLVVGTAAFLGMVVSSPAVLSVNPLLLKPTIAEFGWSRGTISSAYLIAAPIMAVLYMVVGPALDRFGARRLLLVGYILFGASTALLSLMDGSIAQLLLLKVIVTSCATLPTGVAFGKVISSHFSARRGTMLGFCLGGGGGLGMMLMPLIGAAVLEQAGWRLTYVVVGAIAAAVGLIATSLLPPDAPRAGTMAAPADVGGESGSVAWRTPTFLIMLAATLISCMVLNGTIQHLAAIMTDVGMSTHEAALTLSIYALSMICGQFGVGLLADRIASPRIMLPILFLAMTGIFLLYGVHSKLTGMAGAACVGASAGSEYGLLPYMITRYFGLRSFGRLYGLIYAAAAFGTGFGPYVMGATYDLTGSYDRALLAFGAGLVVVVVLMARLPGYIFAANGDRLEQPGRPETGNAGGVVPTA